MCSYEGNIDFRVFGGGGGGLLSIFTGSGGVSCGGKRVHVRTSNRKKEEYIHVIKYALVRGGGCFLRAAVPLKRTRGCQSRAGVSSEAWVGGSLGCQWHRCH